MRTWVGVALLASALFSAATGCGGETSHDTARPDAQAGAGGSPGSSGTAGAATTGTGGAGSGGVHDGGTGGAGAGGAARAGGAGEAGAAAGAAGAAGAPGPGLCQLVQPLPPGCPCTDSAQCDGFCLAPPSSSEPCELATAGFCANPPGGGCVCYLQDGEAMLLCVEREFCPEQRPGYPESCNLVGQVCTYDTPAHERCWCMDRFGQAVWECARTDPDCPYDQPTPESPCTGDLECFFATASSLAYRCTCMQGRWHCEGVGG